MATNRLGVLTIDLIAKTGGFEEGMDNAARRAERFGREIEQTENRVQRSTRGMRQSFNRVNKSVDRLSRGLGTIATPITAVAAASVALAARMADLAQQTQSMARALGTSAETLQKWQYILGEVGITGEQVATMFKDLSDKVGEFLATGGGEAAEVFQKLGIGAEQLRGKKPQEVLLLIADALKQVNSQAERVFLMEALADDASRALPILLQGSDAIRQMGQEAENLNVALSNLELQKLVDMDRSFYSITQRLEGLANTFSIQLSPAIQTFAETLGSERITAGLKNIATWLGNIVGVTITAINKLIEYLGIIGRFIGSGVGDYLTSSIDEQIPKLAAEIERAQEAQARLNAEMQDMDMGSRIYEQTQKAYLEQYKLIEGMKTQLQQLKRQQEQLESIGAGSELYRRGFLNNQDTTVKVTTMMDTVVSGGGAGGGTVGTSAANQGSQQALTSFGVKVGDYYAALMDSISGFNQDIKKESKETFTSLTEYAQQAARNIQDALANFLFDPFSEGLDGMLRGFADTIRRMAAEAASARLLSALFGNQFVGGQSQQMGGFLGNLFAGFFATGGNIPAGQFGIAGEAGPELITGPATVTPMKGGGGLVLNQEIINNTGAEVTTEQDRTPNGEALQRIIIGTVNEDLAQRGNFSRALQTSFPQLRRTGET